MVCEARGALLAPAVGGAGDDHDHFPQHGHPAQRRLPAFQARAHELFVLFAHFLGQGEVAVAEHGGRALQKMLPAGAAIRRRPG